MTTSRNPLRIGTRASALARWQADHVAARLSAEGWPCEIVLIQTRGDVDQRTAFGQMAAKGIFVKELEEALHDGRIDLAVHSLKDLPTELPEGLAWAVAGPREDPRDAWVCPGGATLATLPAGARVATGSLRRAAQVRAERPDLRAVPLRGNVQTRLEKVRNGEAEATLLALAGLKRLGLEDQVTEILEPARLTPPMGQGILAIEFRAGELREMIEALDAPEARRAAQAERAFLGCVGGGCRTPVGILAEPEQPGRAAGIWRLTACLADPEGTQVIRNQASGLNGETLTATAEQLAETLLAQAGPALRALLTAGPSLPRDLP